MKAIAAENQGPIPASVPLGRRVVVLIAVAGFAVWRRIEQPARVAAHSPACR